MKQTNIKKGTENDLLWLIRKKFIVIAQNSRLGTLAHRWCTSPTKHSPLCFRIANNFFALCIIAEKGVPCAQQKLVIYLRIELLYYNARVHSIQYSESAETKMCDVNVVRVMCTQVGRVGQVHASSHHPVCVCVSATAAAAPRRHLSNFHFSMEMVQSRDGECVCARIC